MPYDLYLTIVKYERPLDQISLLVSLQDSSPHAKSFSYIILICIILYYNNICVIPFTFIDVLQLKNGRTKKK